MSTLKNFESPTSPSLLYSGSSSHHKTTTKPVVIKEVDTNIEPEVKEIITNASKNKFKNYFEVYESNSQKNTKKNNFIIKSIAPNPEDGKLVIRHQLVFLMDATGSMGPYIEGTKKEIVKFIDTIKQNCLNDMKTLPDYKENNVYLEFQVAVVAYRDFCDNIHYETIDFTTDIKSIENWLAKIEAFGGGDQPEDIQGAFINCFFGVSDKSPKLSWETSGDIAGRSIILMTDAPAHGDNFINCGEELHNYNPLKTYMDEWNLIFDELQRLGIKLIFTKLTDVTHATSNTLKKLSDKKCDFVEMDISQSVASNKVFDHDAGYTNLTRTLSTMCSSSSSSYYCEKTSKSPSESGEPIPKKIIL
jgi:hypothetical protein